MPNGITQRFRILIQWLLITLCLSFASRLAFISLFHAESEKANIANIAHALVYGLRFDFSAFAILFSIPVLLLCISRIPVWLNRLIWYLVLFLFFLYFVLLLGDLIFYSISHRRAAGEIFALFASFKDFQAFVVGSIGYLLIGVPLGIAPFYFIFRKKLTNPPNPISLLHSFIVILLWCFLAIVMVRGGFQGRPLNVAHAFISGDYFLGNVTLNQMFAFLKLSYAGEKMPLNTRYGEVSHEEFQRLIMTRGDKFIAPGYPFYRVSNPLDKPIRKNIVIFVMESWSSGDLGYFGNSYKATPFFDSIATNGMLFEKAYAVGSRSISAIPVIASSVTALFGRPYTTSSFANNRQRGMGEIFNDQGYETIFLAGYKAGAQGFSPYMKVAGFKTVLTRESLNLPPEKSDGVWGIFDEYTFEELHKRLEKTKQPFLAMVTSLHPHHPYKLPENYLDKNYYTNIDRKEHFNALRYSDYALRKYFEKARKSAYYQDTIFIITSDHTYTQNGVLAKFHIPILFYSPGFIPRSKDKKIASQLDILPTLIEMLNLKTAHSSMGKSLLSEKVVPWAVIDLDTSMGMLMPPYALLANADTPLGIYNMDKDPAFSHNLLNSGRSHSYERQVKTWYTFMNHVSRSISGNRISPSVQ